jgi:hypothetical protein
MICQRCLREIELQQLAGREYWMAVGLFDHVTCLVGGNLNYHTPFVADVCVADVCRELATLYPWSDE